MSYHRYFKWSTPRFDGIVEGKCCCPCCGYPTLNYMVGIRNTLHLLVEDDGTGDKKANFVAGGPNGSYSLMEARANFEHHGDMYKI